MSDQSKLSEEHAYRVNAAAAKVADAMHDAAAVARDECLWLAAKCRELGDEVGVLKARLAMTELSLRHHKEREAQALSAQEAQPARQLVSVSSADVERLIAECIPGGSVCDPQAVADNIRRFCNAWPEQAAQPVAVAPAVSGPSGNTIADFAEGQWWLHELDAVVEKGTPDQKRAVAVVRNLLRTAHAAQPVAVEPFTVWVDPEELARIPAAPSVLLTASGARLGRLSMPLYAAPQAGEVERAVAEERELAVRVLADVLETSGANKLHQNREEDARTLLRLARETPNVL